MFDVHYLGRYKALVTNNRNYDTRQNNIVYYYTSTVFRIVSIQSACPTIHSPSRSPCA